MNGRGAVYAKPNRVSHPSWNSGYADKGTMRYPAREFWLKRGGIGKMSGNGPSGWKLTPAHVLSRSLADMASKYKKVRK